MARLRTAGALLALLVLAPALRAAAQTPSTLRSLEEAAALVDSDPQAAADRYQAIVSGGDAAAVAPALLGLARARLAAGDAEAAAAAAESLISMRPTAPEVGPARLVRGEAYARQATDDAGLNRARDELLAVRDLARAAGGEPDWGTEAVVRAGEMGVRLGEPDRAAALFLEAVDLNPPSRWQARASLALADLMLGRGDWEAAADVLSGALAAADRYPKDAAGSLAALRRRGSLIDRLRLRAAAGAAAWQKAALLPGLALKRPVAVAARDDGALAVVDAGPDEVVTWADGAPTGRRRLPKMGRPFWGVDGAARVPSEDGVVAVADGSRRTPGGVPGVVKRIDAGAAIGNETFLVLFKPLRAAAFDRDLRDAHSLLTAPEGEPQDVAAAPGLGVYVLDGKRGRVLRFAPGEDGGQEVATGLDRPQAIDVDRLGDVFVLERSGRIRVFDSAGKPLLTVGPDLPGGVRLDDPQDLAVDGSGHLYIADPHLSGVVVLE